MRSCEPGSGGYPPASRGWLSLALLLLLFPAAWLEGKQEPPAGGSPQRAVENDHRLSGVVVAVRKYGFDVQSHDRLLTIRCGENAQFRQRLVRPQFQMDQNRIVCEQPSQAEGEGGGAPPIQISYQPPLFIRARFQHDAEMARCWESGMQRRLPRWVLQSDPPGEEFFQPSPGRPELLGRVESIDGRDVATINFGGQRIEALLLDRDATIAGRSIADLEPFTTNVEIRGTATADAGWEASEIIFSRFPDPLTGENPDLPRCLVLGDELSLAITGWIRNETAGKLNVWHPPENCRGGENLPRLPLWSGAWKTAGREWDVIVFNFGLANLKTGDEEYARMLRSWAEALRPTGARLVWLQTVPRLPSGEAGQRADIDRLNRIATATFAGSTAVLVCDPSEGLAAEEMAALKPLEWQKHLAARIARTVLSTTTDQ